MRFDDHQKIEGELIKRGQIDKTAKGQDLIHNSSGEWSVIKVGDQLFLQSSENFRSSPGPDYHVYISSKSAIKDNDEFSAQQIEVSRLKKPNGAAYYLLPTQNPEEVSSMLIWCKQFKEYIGSADFRYANWWNDHHVRSGYQTQLSINPCTQPRSHADLRINAFLHPLIQP